MKLIDIEDFCVYKDTRGTYYALNMQKNEIVKTNKDGFLVEAIHDLHMLKHIEVVKVGNITEAYRKIVGALDYLEKAIEGENKSIDEHCKIELDLDYLDFCQHVWKKLVQKVIEEEI